MNITIRTATPQDAKAIANVNIASWLSTYKGLIHDKMLDNMKPEDYLAKWNNILRKTELTEQFGIVAATDDDKIVGYSFFGKNRNAKYSFDAELYAIYLLQDFQYPPYKVIPITSIPKHRRCFPIHHQQTFMSSQYSFVTLKLLTVTCTIGINTYCTCINNKF